MGCKALGFDSPLHPLARQYLFLALVQRGLVNRMPSNWIDNSVILVKMIGLSFYCLYGIIL